MKQWKWLAYLEVPFISIETGYSFMKLVRKNNNYSIAMEHKG